MEFTSNITEQCPVDVQLIEGEIYQEEVAALKEICDCHLCEIARSK